MKKCGTDIVKRWCFYLCRKKPKQALAVDNLRGLTRSDKIDKGPEAAPCLAINIPLKNVA